MKTTATITMNRTVLERLRERARAEKRTLSQQLELLAENHFHPRRAARRAATAQKGA
jgi:hypothetical protein